MADWQKQTNKTTTTTKIANQICIKMMHISFRLLPPGLTRVSFALPPTADNDNNLNDAYQSCCVFLDEALPVEMQVNQLCKVLYFQLRTISKIRSVLTLDAANILAVAFVLSRFDYCNSLLAGLPDQNLQNFNAYRIVLPDSSFLIHGVKALFHTWKFFTGCLLKPG